jgi:hypothetical protein
MTLLQRPYLRLAALSLTASVGLAFLPTSPLLAADHGDAPTVDQDSGADLADAFIFLDPNDNSRVILAMTVHGFIVPGEAGNFGTFDPNVQYVFELENTDDATPDKTITVRFSEKTSSTSAQMATVKLNGKKFQAPTTAVTLAAKSNPQVVTTDPASDVSFFAGLVDDPFFFDIPGFNRFVASVLAGTPNPALLQRGRDTFAGYNVLGIALSIPLSEIRGPGNTLGLVIRTKRMTQTPNVDAGGTLTEGAFTNVDRMGNPAVNVALIPFAKKDAYNVSTTQDDAAGKFAPDIIATLKALGTNDANIGVLAGVAVAKGDFVRLNLSIANSGPGGGDNAGAGFPNGRRLKDDTIDTLLTIITNGAITTGDNVNASDKTPRNQFPFFAKSHQPRDTDVTDDSTRN